MLLQENRFKKKTLERTTSYGVWNGLVNTVVAEIIACANYDWILIDGEHTPFDIETIQLQLQTLAAYSSEVIVRPPSGDSIIIKKLMDIGVQNLLVPMVETADQAEQLVKDMRYAPQGSRGVGTALGRASRWNRFENYFEKANDEMCLLCQIETSKGLENLNAILDVAHVDGVFIGPADLAASMGLIGQPNHPQVRAKIVAALGTIKAKNKTAGIMALSEDLKLFYEQHGATMFGVAVDTLLLANSAKHTLELMKNSHKT